MSDFHWPPLRMQPQYVAQQHQQALHLQQVRAQAQRMQMLQPFPAPMPPRMAPPQPVPFIEEEDDDGTPSPPLKRQRGEEIGSWASTLPYHGPCFWPATLPAPPCYLEKLDSAVLTIHVGPERKLFQVHKEMFVQAALYFDKLFNGKFIEGSSNSADFPEDDATAWELLVQWCYTGKLPALLRQARDPVFNAEVTKFCSVRLKLCCLADKYGMVLLHNLALDSICEFLGHAAELRLEWKVFKCWCKYVYEHSSEASPLRKFITSYFFLAVKSSKEGDRGNSGNQSQYSIDKLYTLATDVPDLLRDFFGHIRLEAFTPSNSPSLGTWERNPCDWHLHLTNGDVHVQCPMSLVAPVSIWPKPAARLQYFLQDMTLKGTLVCYVSQVMDELGLAREIVQGALKELVEKEVATWVVSRHSFKLTPRRIEDGESMAQIPSVKLVAPTPEERNLVDHHYQAGYY